MPRDARVAYAGVLALGCANTCSSESDFSPAVAPSITELASASASASSRQPRQDASDGASHDEGFADLDRSHAAQADQPDAVVRAPLPKAELAAIAGCWDFEGREAWRISKTKDGGARIQRRLTATEGIPLDYKRRAETASVRCSPLAPKATPADEPRA